MRAYERAAQWSTDDRIAYGADLYASLILTITRAAGLDLTDEVRERFRGTAARVVPGLRDGDERPLVLAHIASDAPEVLLHRPPPAVSDMAPEHVDELILLFGENLKDGDARRAARAAHVRALRPAAALPAGLVRALRATRPRSCAS